jgi:membrane fusion protein, copper/silver efflux system
MLPATILVSALLLAGCGGGADPHAGHGHTPVIQTADSERQLYTCGMHPHIVQEGPGLCPICEMSLVPVRSGSSSDGVVQIDAVTIQNMGVRTAVVEMEALGRSVRATGRFEANERAQETVTLKVGGFVERLHVNYEGMRVRRGQPQLELYSPELVATQQEYLIAYRNAQRLAGSPAVADASRLLDAARRRLAFWDISAAQIERLEQSGQPTRTLTLYAPASGTVVDKMVTQGQQVMPGMPLMKIVGLSPIWLIVDVQEQDLAWVRPGTRATVELPYDPGRTLSGTIDHLYDSLNPESRTVRARITLANPGGELRPGMFANVMLLSPARESVPVVPSEAVIRTGEGAVAVIALGEGRFQPVPVVLGLEADGRVQIREGLQAGQRIVTSAQFLIDSESRLKSAIGAMLAGDSAGPDASLLAMVMDVHAADIDGDGFVFQCTREVHLVQDRAEPPGECTGRMERVSVGFAQSILRDEGFTRVRVRQSSLPRTPDGHVYQSPMHWAVIKADNGNCDVCNMRLERYTVAEAVANLKREGYEVVE